MQRRPSRRQFVQGMAVLGLAIGTPVSLTGLHAGDLSMNGSWIEVNGAQLYYEVRGTGPAVLFIPGNTGDAGHFEQVADVLADAFTVVTYDRRGNSRSPRPAGWTTTSVEEQADDAAGLITALSLVPAAVFSTSAGAVIGVDLLLRHPQLVRGAILHEPPLSAVIASPAEDQALLQSAVQRGIAAQGPRGGVEAVLRLVNGDAAFDAIEPAVRERLLGNGDIVFGIEAGVFQRYYPDEQALAAVQRPVQVMASTESHLRFLAWSWWLASRLGVPLVALPGGHSPYFDRPREMAEAIRPFLSRVSSL
jgi:pimeloyl-ACP methyl ester carboxylesterase